MIINEILLKKIFDDAESSPRLRMNYNLHESLNDDVQRLLNILLPGTLLPIHRHNKTTETYILLKGKMYVKFYNNKGETIDKFLLDPNIGSFGVHIPKGQWHGVEVIEPSAIFEVKHGPYTPLQPEDILQI